MSTYTHTQSNDTNRTNRKPIMMAFLLAAATVLFWLAASSGLFATAQGSASTVTQQRNVWETQSVNSYSYDLQVMCFCFPDMTRPVTIVVIDGIVQSATYTDDGSTADPELFASYSTVEKLFERLENAQSQNPVVFDVTYDAQYGVPQSVNIDIDEMMADEEIMFTVSNFQALR